MRRCLRGFDAGPAEGADLTTRGRNHVLGPGFWGRLLLSGSHMKKAFEYRRHAEECRQLAAGTPLPEQKAQLLEMASTWEMLADQREQELARQTRIAALTSNDSGSK
jgi:hypothetical protein